MLNGIVKIVVIKLEIVNERINRFVVVLCRFGFKFVVV